MKCSQNDQTNQARLLEESNRNEFEIDMFREKKIPVISPSYKEVEGGSI